MILFSLIFSSLVASATPSYDCGEQLNPPLPHSAVKKAFDLTLPLLNHMKGKKVMVVGNVPNTLIEILSDSGAEIVVDGSADIAMGFAQEGTSSTKYGLIKQMFTSVKEGGEIRFFGLNESELSGAHLYLEDSYGKSVGVSYSRVLADWETDGKVPAHLTGTLFNAVKRPSDFNPVPVEEGEYGTAY